MSDSQLKKNEVGIATKHSLNGKKSKYLNTYSFYIYI